MIEIAITNPLMVLGMGILCVSMTVLLVEVWMAIKGDPVCMRGGKN